MIVERFTAWWWERGKKGDEHSHMVNVFLYSTFFLEEGVIPIEKLYNIGEHPKVRKK